MDIEGAELDVLEGGERLLAGSDAPALLFESFDVTRLLPTLLRFGYHVRRLHYTLADGLALPDALAPLDSLFAAYESPNYFASKDSGLFDSVIADANGKRAQSLRLLGRL